MTNAYAIRNAESEEFRSIGRLLVTAYSQLDGFLKPAEHPNYYHMLQNAGDLTAKAGTEILVAVSPQGQIAGAVVYFSDMKNYGSGGTATHEKKSAGFRLLAVDPSARGQGVGKLLTLACVAKAKEQKRTQVIIHTTKAMLTAWAMYEKIGFKRSEDLDFMQGEIQVFGFRLKF